MNIIMIGLIAVAIYCLINRSEKERTNSARQDGRATKEAEQIERLKSRVAVLEEILLDRDRRLRDGFRGL